jgi:hypothetical protein
LSSTACFSSSAATPAIPELHTLRAEEIRLRTQHLSDATLSPLNRKFLGPLPRDANQEKSASRPPMPLVFLLGNHSSGKSTFVNYLLGQKIQTTGVAPTDDSFTVIAPGDVDADQDGPALVGNPDSGFGGLRAYGPNLVNHVSLKVRAGLSSTSSDIMIVDSPGMIDSPAGSSNPWDFAAASRDRGYDFQGVTRWFAERADVICLFFDPDKPGTTGETLATLTNSLSGMDHKLLIILHKVDQFERIHDFARSYGSLCWNLSKVIPRKDLPRIYTMCIPGHTQENSSLVDVLDDLALQREEVMTEVRKAPLRRVDNLITTLYDDTRMLRTHVVVAEAVRAAHSSTVWKARLSTAGVLCAGGAISGALASTGALLEFGVGMGLLTAAATALTAWQGQNATNTSEKHLTSREGLDNLFRETHMLNLAEGDEFLEALWDRRVRTEVLKAVKTLGPAKIPGLSNSEIGEIDEIIAEEVPALRKMSNPLEAWKL